MSMLPVHRITFILQGIFGVVEVVHLYMPSLVPSSLQALKAVYYANFARHAEPLETLCMPGEKFSLIYLTSFS